MAPSSNALLEACNLIECEWEYNVGACASAFDDLKEAGKSDIRREVRNIHEVLHRKDFSTAVKKAKIIWSLSHIRQIAREFPK